MAEYAAVNRRALTGQRRTLVTPEGVDLQLTLAAAGQRCGAFMLDLIIMLGALILLSLAALLLLAATGKSGMETGAVIWLLGFFLLRNFYFIILEMRPRAATFGNQRAAMLSSAASCVK